MGEENYSYLFFLGEGVFKQYQRAGRGKGGSGGEREGPQPDEMATHDHRHYRHHRHSRGCRTGAPDQASNHPRLGGDVEGGRGHEKGEEGWTSPTDLPGSVL